MGYTNKDPITITVDQGLKQRVDDHETLLADIANYTIKLSTPTFLFDGSDETAKLQAIIDQYVSWSNQVTIEFPSNKTIKLDGLQYNGRLIVKGNNCKIRGNGGYVFINKPNSGAHLNISDLYLENVGLADFEMGLIASGLRVKARNIYGYGSGTETTPAGIFYNGTSNDFLDFQNICLYYYDTAFKIQYTTDVTRMNTQLHFGNIDVHYCKTGINLKGIDKATFDNIDMQRVGIGVILGQYSRRINFRNLHVENYGNYSDAGYGLLIANVNQISGISLNQCGFMLPGANAVNAINIPPITDTTILTAQLPQIRFNDVFVDSIGAGNTVVLNGFFEWNSPLPSDKLSLYSSANVILSGIVNPTFSQYTYNKNLLPVSEIIDSTSFGTFGTNLALSSSGFMKKIINNDVAEKYCQLNFTVNEVGWYTLVFNGGFDSGTSNNRIIIAQDASPFTAFTTTRCYNQDVNKTNRLYFYVADTSVTNIRLRFYIQPTNSLFINSIGVYRGFKSTF